MIFFLIPSKYHDEIVKWLKDHHYTGVMQLLPLRHGLRSKSIIEFDDKVDNNSDLLIPFILTYGEHIISRMG